MSSKVRDRDTSTWPRTFLVGLAVAILCSFVTPNAEAQMSREQRIEAAQRFDRGVELYRQQNYEASLAEFLRAHEIAPVYHVLYNIGKVYSFLHRYAESRRAFERYLEEGGSRINPMRRAEVEAELRRLTQLVSTLTVRVEGPEGSLVLLDGNEVGRTPLAEPLEVAAGDHVIEARAEGFHPAESRRPLRSPSYVSNRRAPYRSPRTSRAHRSRSTTKRSARARSAMPSPRSRGNTS